MNSIFYHPWIESTVQKYKERDKTMLNTSS